MKRLAASAKYSSEHEMTEAPKTLVLRFVVDENVESIWSAGTGEITILEEDPIVAEGSVSRIVSGDSAWTSILAEIGLG